MKKNLVSSFADVFLIVILFACASILFKECAKKTTQKEVVSVDTIYVENTDTVFLQLKPKTIFVEKKVVSWKTKVDTVLITETAIDSMLNNCYSEYLYTDTLKDDTITIVINDDISQNQIVERDVNYRLNQIPVIREHIYIKQPKVEFYPGFFIGKSSDFNNFNMGGSVAVRVGGDKIFSAHADVINRHYFLTAYYKFQIFK